MVDADAIRKLLSSFNREIRKFIGTWRAENAQNSTNTGGVGGVVTHDEARPSSHLGLLMNKITSRMDNVKHGLSQWWLSKHHSEIMQTGYIELMNWPSIYLNTFAKRRGFKADVPRTLTGAYKPAAQSNASGKSEIMRLLKTLDANGDAKLVNPFNTAAPFQGDLQVKTYGDLAKFFMLYVKNTNGAVTKEMLQLVSYFIAESLSVARKKPIDKFIAVAHLPFDSNASKNLHNVIQVLDIEAESLCLLHETLSNIIERFALTDTTNRFNLADTTSRVRATMEVHKKAAITLDEELSKAFDRDTLGADEKERFTKWHKQFCQLREDIFKHFEAIGG